MSPKQSAGEDSRVNRPRDSFTVARRDALRLCAPQSPAQRQSGEAGYMLLAVVVMAALVLIALAVAAPVVARDLRRDREVESEHRAQQYVRAIQLYYKKTNSYPPSIKALEGSNNIRYLRQQYVDPLTGQANWRLIHQGEQKTTIKGFFGKELAGLPTGGLGSAAGMSSGFGAPIGGSAAGSASTTVTGTNALNMGFGGAQVGSASSPGAAGGPGVGGSGVGGATGTGGATGVGGSPGTSGSPGSTGDSGMFGDSTGGVIVGVGPAKTGNSILDPNGQTTYETWEFWYDPRIELLKKNVNILGGGIASQPASSVGSDAVSGQPNGAPGTATPPAGSTTTPGGTTTPPTTTPGSGPGGFPQ